MTPEEYQVEARRTLIFEPDHEISGHDIMLVWCAIGLAGESGEVAELIKKGVFHNHGVDNAKLKSELGDVLWYVASLCTLAGFDMSDVMVGNILKLERRYPNGYNSEDSKHG